MPFYEVTHSFPLTASQKTELAERITSLHSHAFTTPSMFINVAFHSADATVGTYFMGGKPKKDTLNRIQALVRTAEHRKKEHFDKLAADLEQAWLEVGGERAPADDEEAQKKLDKAKKEQSETETLAKQLNIVRFVPMITVREKGVTIPDAGDEGSWIKENRKHFEERAELGDQDFKDMLDEINERDDFKAWRA